MAPRNFAKPFIQLFASEEFSNHQKKGFLPFEKFLGAGKTNFQQSRKFFEPEKPPKTRIEIS